MVTVYSLGTVKLRKALVDKVCFFCHFSFKDRKYKNESEKVDVFAFTCLLKTGSSQTMVIVISSIN